MRGEDIQSQTLVSYVRTDDRIPSNHPPRLIRQIADVALAALSGQFDAVYAAEGRPSIPPERLLRALLIQAFYSVRSERQLMEQLNYNLPFRWFVGLAVGDPVRDPSTFSKNRERVLNENCAACFLDAGLNADQVKGLVSGEHSSVDACLTKATGTAEPEAALAMLSDLPGGRRVTVGADKAHDTAAFVAAARAMNVTPHVTRNINGHHGSNIDERTTRHPGYLISLTIRERIEEANACIKDVAGMARAPFRGPPRMGGAFKFRTTAYNLIRMPGLRATG